MCFENPWSGLRHLPSVGDWIQHDLSHFRGKWELFRVRTQHGSHLREGNPERGWLGSLLLVDVVDQHPDHLHGPGGARLWETHNPDVVVSRFKVVQETPWSSLPLLLRGLPTNIEANLFVS